MAGISDAGRFDSGRYGVSRFDAGRFSDHKGTIVPPPVPPQLAALEVSGVSLDVNGIALEA